MSTTASLQSLMIDELRDLYDAEKQLAKALPKLASGSSSDDLREAIETHLEQTKAHVERLERTFDLLGEKANGRKCAGVAGIIHEGETLLASDLDGAVKDAGIIAGAQRAEHYEIGAYGTVIAWARQLGHDDVASLLHDTLEEEKQADRKLTELAEGGINDEASEPDAQSAEIDDERATTMRARPQARAKGRR